MSKITKVDLFDHTHFQNITHSRPKRIKMYQIDKNDPIPRPDQKGPIFSF